MKMPVGGNVNGLFYGNHVKSIEKIHRRRNGAALAPPSLCAVRVTGPTGTQGAEGFWSWGGGIFKLEARFAIPVKHKSTGGIFTP
jgi:hypothetical protein